METDADGWQELAFGVCAATTVGMQLLGFAIAFSLGIDKVTDLAGCANFVVLALLTLLVEPCFTARKLVLTGLVCLSRVQLGAYLLYRVLKRGHDARFDELRAQCLPFLAFWIYQMIWVFVVSAPLIFVNSTRDPDPPLGVLDYVGWGLFGVGFLVQVVSDAQKNTFRANRANAKSVCNVGLWHFSRHPNFFGEILMWWGIFVGGCPVFEHAPAAYATVVSPLFTMWILLCLSGIPTAEGQNAKRWYDGSEAQHAYEDYFASTPPLIPFPPPLYRRMPIGLKRLLCCELPSYEYRPLTEAHPETPSKRLNPAANAESGTTAPSQKLDL